MAISKVQLPDNSQQSLSAEQFVGREGSMPIASLPLIPNMDNAVPKRTIDWERDLYDSVWHPIFSRSNTDVSDVIDRVVFRVTSSSFAGVHITDFVVSFKRILAAPVVYFNSKADYDYTDAPLYQIRLLTPKALNSGYPWVVEGRTRYAVSNATTIEIFQDSDAITWYDSVSSTIYNSEYYTTSVFLTNRIGLGCSEILNLNVASAANAIESISFNGTAATITGKAAEITYTETDPTVPAWAKASTKPTYTASEVGALPSTTTIPTKTSDLTNDSGFITNPGVTSFNGSTGAVTYTAPVTSVNGSTGAVTIAVPTATSDLTNDSGFQSLAYTAISSDSSTTALVWKTMYQWTVNPTSITVTLPSAPSDPRGEIVLKFTTGSTAPTMTWPSALKWANGEELSVEASTTYEFSIGYDMMGGWTIVGCGFSAA